MNVKYRNEARPCATLKSYLSYCLGVTSRLNNGVAKGNNANSKKKRK